MLAEEDYYWENGFIVFTAKYHLKRGTCCRNQCRHCPWNYGQKKTKKDKKGTVDNETGTGNQQ
jgi:hypothetical protein